jgi:hypothetical protein
MKDPSRSGSRAALLVAGIDACVVIVGAFAIALADGKSPADLVLRRTELLVGFVVPVAVTVSFWAWLDLRRFAGGRDGLRRPAGQAFVLGFLPRPLSDALGIVREAVAAGPAWPSPGHSSAGEWVSYSAGVFVFATIAGVFAALIAIVLVLANRRLYVKLATKASKQPGVRPAG